MGVKDVELYVHAQAAGQQRPFEHLAQFGGFRIDQDWKRAEVGKIDRPAFRQRVGFRSQRENRLSEQLFELKFQRAFNGGANAKIDFSPSDAFQEIVRRQFAKVDVDAGVGGSKGRQRFWKDGRRNRRNAADG